MWQTVIVFLVIACAFFFVGRSYYQKFKPKSSSGCGCCDEGCDAIQDLKSLDAGR